MLGSCRHDADNDSSLSPCHALKANSLTFHYLEYTGTPSADTVYNNQPVTFVGPGAPYTAYEWLVGPSTRRTAQTFALSFDAKTRGNIPVRLIARRPPNTACFPHDDGIDTLTQILTLMPNQARSPIYGKFQGANRSSPRDTFTVRVYQGPNFDHPNNPAADLTNYLTNLPKGCQTPYFEIGLAWRGVHFASGGCKDSNGMGYLIGHDSIRIVYTPQYIPPVVEEVFLGKRIR